MQGGYNLNKFIGLQNISIFTRVFINHPLEDVIRSSLHIGRRYYLIKIETP